MTRKWFLKSQLLEFGYICKQQILHDKCHSNLSWKHICIFHPANWQLNNYRVLASRHVAWSCCKCLMPSLKNFELSSSSMFKIGCIAKQKTSLLAQNHLLSWLLPGSPCLPLDWRFFPFLHCINQNFIGCFILQWFNGRFFIILISSFNNRVIILFITYVIREITFIATHCWNTASIIAMNRSIC